MARSITKVSSGIIKDGTITLSKLATTGTASSSTVLFGNFAWSASSPSGNTGCPHAEEYDVAVAQFINV